jgi:hypothetical protein
MKKSMYIVGLIAATLFASSVFAKLPDPTPEAKEAADLAKAKSAYADKVAAFKLCKSQNKVASTYAVKSKVVDTPACVEPGEFTPPVAAATTPPATVAAKPIEPVKK